MYNIFMKFRQIIKVNKKIILLVTSVMLIIPSVILAQDGDKSVDGGMIRPKAADVENMTLIYGTHMVYIDSLTSELNDIIEKSAKDIGQDKIYYKSELTDNNRDKSDKNGMWYEVQNATSVDDISFSNTKIVSDSVIDRLQIDYYTPSDGKTYDLKTGQEIDIFGIDNIYDISSMEELKSLNLKYNSIKDSNTDDETDKKEKQSLESVLKLDVRNNETDNLDSEMDYLKKYSDYVNQKNESEVSDEEKSKLSEIRGAKNAERKILVIDKVTEKIDEEIKNVRSLVESYGEAESELINSKTMAESKKAILETGEDETAIRAKQAELIQSLINNVKNNNYQAADENLKNLVVLDNISSGLVVDKSREKDLVDGLEKKAKEDYFKLATSGESEEYKQAKALNKSEAVLDGLKNNHKDKLRSKFAELTSMSDTSLKLLDTTEEKTKKLEDDINETNDYIAKVSSELRESTLNELLVSNKDAFKKIGLDSLNSRVSELQDKAQLIEDFLNKNNNELSLSDELQTLKEERQKALDKGDLVGAKKAKSQMDSLQKTIDEKQKENDKSVANLNGQLKTIDKQLGASGLSKSDKVALEKQKASVKSAISKKLSSSSGKTKVVKNITKTATKDAKTSLSKIPMKKEDVTNLSDSVSKVKSVMSSEPDIASEAMKEIDEAIKDKASSGEVLPESFSDVANEVSQTVEEYKDSHEDSDENKLDNNLKEEDLTNNIETFALDKELNDITKNLLALGSMSNLLETYGPIEDNVSYEDLSEEQTVIKKHMEKILSSIISDGGNSEDLNIKLIDKKFKNSENYAPADVVSDFKNMRYVWDRNLLKAWLIKKNTKYGFIQGKNSVILLERNKTMRNPAIFEPDRDNMKTLLWLPASFLLDEFGLTVQNLNTINKSIVYDQESYEIMKDMLESLSNI